MTKSIETLDRFDGQALELRLGPPPANLITDALVGELSNALDAAERRQELKLVILCGEGDHFSFGASVQEHRADEIPDVLPRFHDLIGKLLEYPIPTMAAVRGSCLGGGFELALACSFIIAEASAGLGLPEIRLGVFPPVGALLLGHAVAPQSAAEAVLGGNVIAATQWKALGVVSQLAPPGELEPAVELHSAQTLLDKSAFALRQANLALRGPLARHYRAHIGAIEERYLGELMESHDANEGVEAFLSKRAAEWKNC